MKLISQTSSSNLSTEIEEIVELFALSTLASEFGSHVNRPRHSEDLTVYNIAISYAEGVTRMVSQIQNMAT